MGTQGQYGRFTCTINRVARMFQFLILMIVIALVAGALGFTGIAAGAAVIAKIVFGIMIVGIVIGLLMLAFGISILG